MCCVGWVFFHGPLIPSEVLPFPTALSAYSICKSLPDGLNVVKEKLWQCN